MHDTGHLLSIAFFTCNVASQALRFLVLARSWRMTSVHASFRVSVGAVALVHLEKDINR